MGGTAVLNMNDEFNLFGQKAYISGRVFETFPPIPDAPTEKELVIEQAEEEGSLFGNFAFGALVTASLGALTYVAFGAAFAAATVATGGALLVVGACLAGATAAAATVTVAATVTDYQSGHVRTADEFASQLAAGTALGAVTGATLYGLWYGIPGASILMGADLAGLFASSSPVAAVAFSKAAALAGYFLMGSQVIRYASEISSLGTGYNWMLEQLFGGDAVIYSDATTLMDALAAYTVIVGWENMPEKQKESRENLIKYGKMDTSLIGEGTGQATNAGFDTTRINIANGSTRFSPSNNAGLEHVKGRHFSPGKNAGQFSITVDELKDILGRKDVINTVGTISQESGQYVRVVDVGQNIGTIKPSIPEVGGQSTSWIAIYTDVKGNLITAYPVPAPH